MLTEFARTRAKDLLNALAVMLHRLGLTPNALTVIGFSLVCLSALVIAAGYEALGALLLIFSAGFDATDGAVARLTGRVSKFGAFLDSTLDRYADGVLFLAVMWRGIEVNDRLLIVLSAVALLGSLIVSYTRARAEGLGQQMKEGWFTRLERMIVLVLGLLSTVLIGTTGLLTAVTILAIFANVTAIQRILAVREKLSDV